MGLPEGFRFNRRKNGEVVITHHGRVAATLRATTASRFVARIEAADADEAQQLMARATGNYRRGNERAGR